MELREENIKYFKENLQRLLQDVAYNGKFVIIHNAKIEGVYDSFNDALNFAVSKFDSSDFIIQQVIDEKDRINFICSAVI